MKNMKLTVTVSKTRQGDKDYLQVLSEDQFSINIVLLADKIELQERRT